jgi:glycosyltransferase involved in cell wall biosynthesis
MVIATGRAAVEAMACGAPVVIADCREYQGALLDPDPVDAMTRNYRGRGGIVPTLRDMRVAIGAALDRGSLRAHAERFHNVREIAEELLCCNC